MQIKIAEINHNLPDCGRVTILWDSESCAIVTSNNEDTELRADSAELARDIALQVWGAKEWGLSLRSASSILAEFNGAKGGESKSDKKTEAAKENGKKGGRPKKDK